MENADDSDTESGMYWSAVVTYVYCVIPVLYVLSECNHFENRSFYVKIYIQFKPMHLFGVKPIPETIVTEI